MEEQNKVNIEVVSIDDLIQDDHNFNKGNEQGAQLLERSFRECGAGRSVLIDKDNRLVGGNKAQQGFKAAGKKKVIIVDSDADTLVAVRRKDVSLDSAEGRKMAYLDNLSTQVNLTWDQAELQEVQADVEGFEVADFGFDIEDLPVSQFGDANPTTTPPGEGEGGDGDGEGAEGTPKDNYNIIYSLVFNNEQEQETWFKFLRKLKAQHPEMETISERVIHFITNSEIWQE